MITQVLHCPYCQGTDIVKHGLSPEGKQRYRCRACREGRGRTFLLAYSYAGQSPAVKQQIVDMAMNASGIRDTARVLHVSPTTVINELRRFLKKNLPFQDVGAGLIKMSYLGNAGWRFNRASTACIAALPSEMPLLYTLRLSLTTG